MKSLKVIAASLALSVLVASPIAFAQEKKAPQTPEQQIERIEQAVGSLTAAQKTKIQAIFAKTQASMKGVAKEDRKDKMAEAMKKQTAEIKAVLTPEQAKKYDAAMAKKKK
jgi:Spy/CpxP family protein refolding chaperone